MSNLNLTHQDRTQFRAQVTTFSKKFMGLQLLTFRTNQSLRKSAKDFMTKIGPKLQHYNSIRTSNLQEI